MNETLRTPGTLSRESRNARRAEAVPGSGNRIQNVPAGVTPRTDALAPARIAAFAESLSVYSKPTSASVRKYTAESPGNATVLDVSRVGKVSVRIGQPPAGGTSI